MAMTPNVARGSIIVGSIGLVVATICFILGIVSSQLLSGHPSASAGFWSLVFTVPGILSIIAGKYKNTTAMAFALVFSIIATIVAGLGAFYCIAFWIILRTLGDLGCIDNSYNLDCSKVNVAIAIIASLTILLFILATTSLANSILGCLGTCCAPGDTIIINTSVVSQPSAVVVNTQTSTQNTASSYYPMALQNPNLSAAKVYRGPPAPAYGVQNVYMVPEGDDVPLLQNV